jgi:type IV secretory pathway TrbL component
MDGILITLILVGVAFIIYSFFDLFRQPLFSFREKTNLSCIISFLPFVGYFIYFLYKWERKGA